MRIGKRKWNRGLVPVPCIEGFLNCNTAASATGESRGKKGEPAGILQALLLDINIRNLLIFDWRFLTTTHNVL